MKSFPCWLAATMVLLASQQLHATIMVPLAVGELTGRAELILHGTVASKICLKDSEGRIYTKIEFDVSEVWKGTLSNKVFVIVHGGGTVGDERTVVDGEANYEVGEELVAFLRLNQRGEGVSIGLAQGQFHVWKVDDTGEKFAHNLFHGKPKAAESPAQSAFRAAAGKPTRLGLMELRQRVEGGAR
jgi:hypothetical protein